MFFSEPIEVVCDSTNMPQSFLWRKRSYRITEILSCWQDWGFSPGVFKADWRGRRHRNYYQVECDDETIYEIYLDRQSVNDKSWFLYRSIDKSDLRG